MQNKKLPRHSLTISLAAAMMAGVSALAFTASSQSNLAGSDLVHHGSELEISGFIGTLEIRNGPSLMYELDMGEHLVPDVDIHHQQGRLVVDGAFNEEIRGCDRDDDEIKLRLRGGAMRPLSDYPHLIITMPHTASVSADIRGGRIHMGDAQSMDLEFEGCGYATFGEIADATRLVLRGSGDITGGNIGPAEILLQGSGDVEAQNVNGDAEITLMGSGDIEMNDVSGQTSVLLQGSGDVSLGRVSQNSNVVVRGSGDVDYASGHLQMLGVELYGSGDVNFNGDADDVSVLLYGSGDVYVAGSTGNRVVNRYGPGDVRIGSWRSDDGN